MKGSQVPRDGRPSLRLRLASALIFGALGWSAAAALVGLFDPLELPPVVVTAGQVGATLVVGYAGVLVASYYRRLRGPLALRIGDAATVGGLVLIALVMILSLLGQRGPTGRSDIPGMGALLMLAVMSFGVGIACVAGFFALRTPDVPPATRASLLVMAVFGAGLAAAGLGVLAGVIA